MLRNKVLITGIAGFIGSHLLDYLIENTDWDIVGVDNLSTGRLTNIEHHLKNERVSFIQGKCSDITTLKPFRFVFHLAALPRIQPSFEYVNDHIDANLNQAVHILELMIRENYFPRFIYSSSSAIYGTPKTIPTPETEHINCLSPYAFQKYEVEKYLELLATRYPIDYVNLRYFNPYGPRSFNPSNQFNAYSSVVGIFLERKKYNQPLLVTGNGDQKRDFIHVRDLVRANFLAAIHGGELRTSFNIGNGSTISVLDLAKKIGSDIQFIDQREGEAQITFADISKAARLLSWAPLSNLDDYIKKALSNEE